MKWSSANHGIFNPNLKFVHCLAAVTLMAVLMFPAGTLANQDKSAKGTVGLTVTGTGTLNVTLKTSDGSNLPVGAGWTFHSDTTGSTVLTEYEHTGTPQTDSITFTDDAATTGVFKLSARQLPGYGAFASPFFGSGTILSDSGTVDITVTYFRDTGGLNVNIVANGSGGSFGVSGPTGTGDPSDFTDFTGMTTDYSNNSIPTGGYTVTFTEIPGYTLTVTTEIDEQANDRVSVASFTPFTETNPSTGTIEIFEIHTVTGTYTRQTGTLNVNITDNGSGGSFSISGPTGQGDPSDFTDISGETSNFSDSVPTGTYTVTFTDQTGYTLTVTTSAATTDTVSPAAATPFNESNPSSGTINEDETHTVNGEYTLEEATLNVNITDNGSGGSFTISGPSGFNGGSDLTGQTSNFSDTVPTGTYTVTFTTVSGFNLSIGTTSFSGSSNSASGTLGNGDTETVEGTYIEQEAGLIVNITDNGSGGSFSISGPSGFNGGSDLTGQTSNFSGAVPIGTYTVTFTPVSGFDLSVSTTSFTVTSNVASGDLGDGDIETVEGVYTENEATLNVNITPNGSSGSFSISGPSGFTDVTGQTSNYSETVPLGSYTVAFTTPSGFDLAVSATSFTVGSNTASGTLGSSDTETVEGVYTEHLGNLQGFIEPIAAKNEGGQWRLKNASGWRDSGDIAKDIPVGTYTVEFKAISGWTKPSDATVVILENETTTVTGVYTQSGGTGSLQVFIDSNEGGDDGEAPPASPAAIAGVSGRIPEGAQWRPIYPSSIGPTTTIWYDSGHIITGIPVGDVGIEFRLVNGYVLPDLRGATIKPNVVDKNTGEYIRPLIIHKSDYDGNGTEDLPVFNESTRVWSVASVGTTGPSATKTILEQKFGQKNDIPATGDYDGDGIADLAVYREKTATWIVHRQFTLDNFGETRDIPVPGDYNGDGMTDPALFRPDTGDWLIHDINTGKTTVVDFGGPGYIPVPGNWDGDRNEMTDLGIYHVQSGQWRVAVYNAKKERWTERKKYRKVFGTIGDIPIQADYDGDGTTDHAFYDRTDSFWRVLDQFEIQHGRKGVIPVPNDWAGLNRVIPAYFNPITGRWQAVDNLLRTKFGAGGRPLVSGR